MSLLFEFHPESSSLQELVDKCSANAKSPLYRGQVIYHEHFGLTQDSYDQWRASPLEDVQTFVEMFLDTSTFDLMKKDCWLRLRNDEWTLKEKVFSHQTTCPLPSAQVSIQGEGLIYWEHYGKPDVMRALEKLLPSTNNIPCTPFDYCPFPFASFTTRRYSRTVSPRLKWWVDCCFFKKNSVYVIGTLFSPRLPHHCRYTSI